MKRRAEQEAETRLRITESAVALHGELGPVRTSLSAVAEHAGVRRSTLYRHFPDEAAILAACTSHWGAQHPFPDPTIWDGIADPAVRAATALKAYYDYYAGTWRMWFVAYRDVGEVKPIQPVIAHVEEHLTHLADSLASAFGRRGGVSRHLAATLRHALAYSTWSSLEDRGLHTGGKVALVSAWIDGLRKSRA